MIRMLLYFIVFIIGFNSCNSQSNESGKKQQANDSLWVTATAYNSVVNQTKSGSPSIAAWGDTLKPGMKVIAVSRDLIEKGLSYNTPIQIKGLEGIYYVKDKMHKRWTNKIDIYMGLDIKKAMNWGKQQVLIYYHKTPSKASDNP